MTTRRRPIDQAGMLADVIAEVGELRESLVAAEAERGDEILLVHSAHRRSAANLIHYVELRRNDIRALPLLAGPAVVKVRPQRDLVGHVVTPARVLLSHVAIRLADGQDPFVHVPVDDPEWVRRRRVGDRIKLRDGRGVRRHWTVTDLVDDGCVAEASTTSYVITGGGEGHQPARHRSPS